MVPVLVLSLDQIYKFSDHGLVGLGSLGRSAHDRDSCVPGSCSPRVIIIPVPATQMWICAQAAPLRAGCKDGKRRPRRRPPGSAEQGHKAYCSLRICCLQQSRNNNTAMARDVEELRETRSCTPEEEGLRRYSI